MTGFITICNCILMVADKVSKKHVSSGRPVLLSRTKAELINSIVCFYVVNPSDRGNWNLIMPSGS